MAKDVQVADCVQVDSSDEEEEAVGTERVDTITIVSDSSEDCAVQVADSVQVDSSDEEEEEEVENLPPTFVSRYPRVSMSSMVSEHYPGGHYSGLTCPGLSSQPLQFPHHHQEGGHRDGDVQANFLQDKVDKRGWQLYVQGIHQSLGWTCPSQVL
jgi:hypothetical protein